MPKNFPTDVLIDGSAKAKWTIALAHGAGAPMDSEFMTTIAEGLAARQFQVVRFEFPYMAERRKSGRKKPPDREPVLRQTWLDMVAALKPERLIIGGKSLGGRIASLVADEAKVAGLVCLGYPFHPTGQPDRLRVEHLSKLKTPTLILQGERDPFGNREEVAGYSLSKAIKIHWLTDGDHSFKPRKSSGRTERENFNEAVEEIAAFVSKRKVR